MAMSVDTKLRRAHIKLMRHPETCLYSGVILMGKTTIVDEPITACTNGVDTKYGSEFMAALSDTETTGVVLHENLHKALRQIMRYRGLMKEDALTANAAMDYVVNDLIVSLNDKTLATLPKGALHDARFRNWDVLGVYDYLRTGNPPPPPPQGGQGKPQDGDGQGKPLPQGTPQKVPGGIKIGNETFGIGTQDTHDGAPAEGMTADEVQKIEKQIAEALQQGGMLAGRMGANVPRVIKDSLVDPIDWAAEMRDFVQVSTSGKSEYTYRRYNRRFLADDLYYPHTEDETVGEVIFAIDTSGSIGGEILSAFAARVSEVCEMVKPDRVRILWWDTMVHAEQVFDPAHYADIRRLLKPMGGGGTHVSCVADYLRTKQVSADCLVVFTDGYVEHNINWDGVTCPTLWLITHYTQLVVPPGHRKVKVDRAH